MLPIHYAAVSESEPAKAWNTAEFEEYNLSGEVVEIVRYGRHRIFSHYLIATNNGESFKLPDQYYQYTKQELESYCRLGRKAKPYRMLIRKGDRIEAKLLRKRSQPIIDPQGVEWTITIRLIVSGAERFSLTKSEYVSRNEFECINPMIEKNRKSLFEDAKVTKIALWGGNIFFLSIAVLYSIFRKRLTRALSVREAKQSRAR